ncbi:MAG: hypothetical protein EOQ41_19445, partial [Mesorhizobium sp.]
MLDDLREKQTGTSKPKNGRNEEMKPLLKTALAATLIALSGAFSASAEQIKVGFSPEAYPPFYSQDASGNWGGWEV